MQGAETMIGLLHFFFPCHGHSDERGDAPDRCACDAKDTAKLM